MSISRNEVTAIAHLARLGLTEEELSHFQGQLESILEYVDQLKSLDVSQVEPMTHVLELKNIYRKDIPKPSLDPQTVLGMAPAVQGQFYKVPKMMPEFHDL